MLSGEKSKCFENWAKYINTLYQKIQHFVTLNLMVHKVTIALQRAKSCVEQWWSNSAVCSVSKWHPAHLHYTVQCAQCVLCQNDTQHTCITQYSALSAFCVKMTTSTPALPCTVHSVCSVSKWHPAHLHYTVQCTQLPIATNCDLIFRTFLTHGNK